LCFTYGSKYYLFPLRQNDEAASSYLWMRWAISDLANATAIQHISKHILKVTFHLQNAQMTWYLFCTGEQTLRKPSRCHLLSFPSWHRVLHIIYGALTCD